ncbi:MAG: cobalamin-binding protein, partial [Planctomycetia bacterium]|nr:cobalamin-binding protein [Planctomycetia bacterium]
MVDLKTISELLQIGNDKEVHALTKKAIEQGIPAKTILDDGLIAGMNVIGEKFR